MSKQKPKTLADFLSSLFLLWRYADDCNIYVDSERAGQRVMESVTHFITHRLKLKVNQAKSAVARPGQRKFLGFSFTGEREPRRRIAPKAIARFKQRIREQTRRTRGISLAQMVKEIATYVCHEHERRKR